MKSQWRNDAPDQFPTSSLAMRLAHVLGSFVSLEAQQPLETETARPPNAESVEMQTAFEHQTSNEGTERAVPFAFEYGITDRLSFMVEPVFYTAIRPKTGNRATGAGDVHPKSALVGEVLINSGSSPEAVAGTVPPTSTVTPEISSGEIVGMGGFRYRLRDRMFFTFGASYDNNHAVLIRPGLTFTFNRPGRTRTQ